MATWTEMWRHAMDGVEHGAYLADNGLMSLGSMSGMNIYFTQVSARMVELLREISGSGMVMQPSEADLSNPEFRPYLDRYMPGKGVGVEYKSRLFRLAHDLAASSFGMRQEIYEYWHGGDPNRNRINLLRTFDQAGHYLTDQGTGFPPAAFLNSPPLPGHSRTERLSSRWRTPSRSPFPPENGSTARSPQRPFPGAPSLP